ncbi:MAG: DUF5686 family protein [Flavobacteriales bacterium]
MPRLYCCLILILHWVVAVAQQQAITGRVRDAGSGRPLPFVNVIAENTGCGTTTDIDGFFAFDCDKQVEGLTFSYVGYNRKTVTLHRQDDGQRLSIYLQKNSYSFDAFTVRPGINPAHRIIRKAIENKKSNNPENLRSYSCTAYNKMVFTADYDSMYIADTNQRKMLDTSDQRALNFLDKRHLLLMEFVSEHKYLRPNHNRETVIASRISGLKNPAFTLLATQMQSFSFYPDYIDIYDKHYVNPVAAGSLSRYLFIMEDTTYSGCDTVFIISFRPRRGRTFDAMQGVLYINTRNFAIENVLAEPVYQRKDGVSVKIRQEYTMVEGHWFPEKLNTDIVYGMLEINNGHKVVGIGRSYLDNIQINPPLSRKDFNDTDVEVADDAGKKEEAYWDNFRPAPLDHKEEDTYRYVDSIGEAAHLDRKLGTVAALMSNRMPLGPLDINLDRLIDYNEYEGFRLGMGLHTGRRISRHFSLGGYWAYGIRNDKHNFGADAKLSLWKAADLGLRIYYEDDVIEPGGTEFPFDNKSIISTYSYRDFLLSRMDNVKRYGVASTCTPFRFCYMHVGFSQQLRQATDEYRFSRMTEGNITFLENSFSITEATVGIRYAYGEHFGQFGDEKFSLGTDFPVLQLRVAKGFDNLLDGQYTYVKAELKVSRNWLSRIAGRFSTSLAAGVSSGDIPQTLLFNARGNAAGFTLFSEGSFETMGVNEFLSDRYIAFSWVHHLFHLTGGGRQFSPELLMVNNAIIGGLQKPQLHYGLQFATPENGFFESGLLINDLLKLNFSGFGIGIFYRYGHYAFPDIQDNLFLKLSLSFDI